MTLKTSKITAGILLSGVLLSSGAQAVSAAESPVVNNAEMTALKPGETAPAEPTHVEYVDANGKQIAPSVDLTGRIGDTKQAVKKTISGYNFKEFQGTDKNGNVILSTEKTVKVVYTEKSKVVAAPVHVKYVDDNGKEIATGYDINGNVGDVQTVTGKDITGYSFEKFVGTDDAAGNVTLGDKEKTIEVVYIRPGQTAMAAPVHVKYVDEAGKEIAKSSDVTGRIGDTKQIAKKAITGYSFKEFKGADDASGNVLLLNDEKTVTVVYAKDTDTDDNGSSNKPGANSNNSNKGTATTDPAVNKPAQRVAIKAKTNKLPQTGENTRNASILSIIGLALLSVTGFVTLNKKKTN